MRKNKAGATQNGFMILTLDDDPNITAALQAYFEGSGYQVDTETDPIAALSRMRLKRYDILLLDFLMQPICGDEVVTRLRAFDKDVFIILLTGHKELAPPLNTLRELDIQGYYEKSNRFDQLELLVESCVKSIRQMQIIREYRDGLGQILALTPQLHRLRPLSQIMEQAARQSVPITNSEGAFVWIDPQYALKSEPEGEPSLTEGLYRGIGQYDVGMGAYLRSIQPGLRLAMEETIRARAVQSTQGFLLAPLVGTNDLPFGLLVVDAISGANLDLTRLFAMYARQASSALHNALLHREATDACARLRSNYLETITALRLLVDAKDIYTRGHSDRVSYYADRLARAVGLEEEQVERVRVAGLFHDVGKVGTSDTILMKTTPLADAEFDEIKKHPTQGARILSTMSMFSDLPGIVEAHHERYDGRGYPAGLAGDDIPLEARIIAIADAFDAMSSDRQYRKHLTPEATMNELRRGRGTQFDAKLVDVFMEMILLESDAMRRDLAWTYAEAASEEGGAHAQ